ncbi:MAG: hypothetical protein AB7S72_20105 [Draconibacterium sp.]
MKPTIFTSQEKELILDNLKKRRNLYQSKEYYKYENDINELITKISTNHDDFYSKKFKSIIAGCINEILYPLEKNIKGYFEMSTINFVNLEKQKKQELALIDQCFSILYKTGFRKSKFKFEDVSLKIEKLKNSELIGLSRTDKKDVYKVGFLIKNESMIWQLRSDVNLVTEEFNKLTKQQTENFAESFTDLLIKSEAKEIIDNCRPVAKNEETLSLIKYLLS